MATIIERIDKILPTIKSFEVMNADFMPLAKELGYPDEWRGKPLTAKKAKLFLEQKREEYGRN